MSTGQEQAAPVLALTAVLACALGAGCVYVTALDLPAWRILVLLLLPAALIVGFALATVRMALFRAAILGVFVSTVALPISYSFRPFPRYDAELARALPAYPQISMVHVALIILTLLCLTERCLGRRAASRQSYTHWPPFATPLAILAGLGLLSVANPTNANSSASLWAAVYMATLLLFVVVVASTYTFRETFLALWWGLAIAVVLQTSFVVAYPLLRIEAATTVFHSSAAAWVARGDTPRAVGTTDHPGMLSLYLGSILPFFVSSYLLGYRRRLALVILVALAADIFLTQARSAMVASLAAVVVVILVVKSARGSAQVLKGLTFAALAVGLFLLFALGTGVGRSLFLSDNFRDMWVARYYHWELGLRLIREYFWLGVGFNSHVDYLARNMAYYASAAPQIAGVDFYYTNPIHNSYMAMFVELGCIGFAAWVAIFIGLATYSYGSLIRPGSPVEHKIAQAWVLGAVVAILSYAPFGWAPLRPIIWQQLALMTIVCDRARAGVGERCSRGASKGLLDP